jgi:hypothetical protein
MAVMTEELVPVLEDARQAHAAVLGRFRADATVTPPGPHRELLERKAAEVQVSVQRIQRQERALHPRGVLGTAVGVMSSVSLGAVRTAMLPLAIGSKVVRDMLPMGRPADPRQLMRNTEDEYAATARALAACRAGEVLAEQAGDAPTAALLGALRRQDEELLRELQDSLADRARAVAASADASGGEGRTADLADQAAQVIGVVLERAREIAERGIRRARGTAEGTAAETAEPTPIAEEILGAVRREEDLPIPGYNQLGTPEIERRLRTLSQLDLTVIEGYERAHAQRRRILDTIEQLRGVEPWTGYDAVNANEITASLLDAPSDVARQVLAYEQRHRQRREVISAAKARVSV